MRNPFFRFVPNAVRPYQLSLCLKQRIHKRLVYAETRLLVPHANAARPYQLSLRLKHRIQKRLVYAKTVFFVSHANAVRPYKFSLRLKQRIHKSSGFAEPVFYFHAKRRGALSAFIMFYATYT